MINELKSDITNSYLLFVNDFADPSTIDHKAIADKAEIKISELLKRQRNADLAKKRLGGDFNKALAIYFDKFLTSDGLDAYSLKAELDKYAKVYQLHLGKDACRYLRLLSNVSSLVDTKPKGLLAS